MRTCYISLDYGFFLFLKESEYVALSFVVGVGKHGEIIPTTLVRASLRSVSPFII